MLVLVYLVLGICCRTLYAPPLVPALLFLALRHPHVYGDHMNASTEISAKPLTTKSEMTAERTIGSMIARCWCCALGGSLSDRYRAGNVFSGQTWYTLQRVMWVLMGIDERTMLRCRVLFSVPAARRGAWSLELGDCARRRLWRMMQPLSCVSVHRWELSEREQVAWSSCGVPKLFFDGSRVGSLSVIALLLEHKLTQALKVRRSRNVGLSLHGVEAIDATSLCNSPTRTTSYINHPLTSSNDA